MNYFPNVNSMTGELMFPLSSFGAINSVFAKTLIQSNNPLFLPYKIANNGVQPTGITIETNNLTSLAERLRATVTAKDLTHLFAQLSLVIETAQTLSLPLMNVVFDTNYMYLANNELSELRFVYLPVFGGIKNVNAVKEFFISLPLELKPTNKEAQDMVNALSMFARNQQQLNIIALGTFLRNLSQAKVSDDEFVVAPKHLKVEQEDSMASGVEIREAPGTMVLNAVEFAEPAEEENKEVALKNNLQVAEARETVQPPKSATSLPLLEYTFWLTSKFGGDKHQLTGARFTVGKSKRANYQIKNTSTVSRIHAHFDCTGDECWITDNNSLNGTFVNDVQLEKGGRQKLYDGDIIVLSDEEFIFNVRQEDWG